MGRRRRNPRADSSGGGGGNSSGGCGGGGGGCGGLSWADEALSASAAAVSFVLLLTGSLLAQPCLSAPTVTRLDPRPWHYPCGDNKQETGVAAPQPSHPRHPAIKALKRVRTQMRIASVHYEKEKSAIDVLHEELKEFKDTAITYSWLPDKQFAWYQTEARCQERHKRLALILPQLHTSLQRYLVTLEEVNRFPHAVNEPQAAAKSRKKVLFELSKELKKWLCEVETALISSRIPVPSRTKEEIIPRDDLDRWHSEPSHTTSLVQTWGVLTAYHRFTQEWQKIFNEALKDTLPASCPGGQKQTSKKQPKTSKPTTNGKQPAKKGKPVGPKKPVPAASKNTATTVRKTTTKKRRPAQPKN